jgi:hypothetical protein
MKLTENVAEVIVGRSIELSGQELRLLKDRAMKIINARSKYDANQQATDLAHFILKISKDVVVDAEAEKELFAIDVINLDTE